MKIRETAGLEASGPFLHGATWMISRAPFPKERRGAGGHQLMTVGHCEWKDRGVIVKLSLFLESLGHGQHYLQELRPQSRRRRLLQLVRCGNHGQRPQPPLPRSAQEISLRTTDTSAATRAHGRQHIRSTAAVPVLPALALHGVTLMPGDRRLLDLRPHLLGVAAQGAQLLFRQLPRAASSC